MYINVVYTYIIQLFSTLFRQIRYLIIGRVGELIEWCTSHKGGTTT